MVSVLVWLLILALASTGVAIAFVHTLHQYLACLRLKAHGVEATGQCMSLTWRQDDVSVHFAYTIPDGTKHDADSFAMAHTSIVPGSAVSVVYDPASPATAELPDRLEPAIRFHRLVLLWITPVLALFATLDIWTALALVV